MSARARQRDREIIGRYTDQPIRLPAELRAEIEHSFDGRPAQLYALVDLDPSLKLTESWLALGPERVAIARREGEAWALSLVDRSRIREVRSSKGMSCHVVTLVGLPDEPPLAVVRYTHRQRRAVDAICFVLEQSLASRDAVLPDGDDEYANAVAGPIREAQALVAGSDSAIIVRLLRYLRPYRGQVAIGMAAAAFVTLLSLLPAYLAGYLIDRVVRRAQDGQLPREAAAQIALICVLAIAAAYALRSLFTWVRLRFLAFLGEYVASDLRTEIYEHLQTLSLSFFSRKKTGSLITRVTSDTDRLWEFLAFGIVDVSLSAVMLLGLGAVLITLDWRLGLVMTVPVPLLCGFIFIHGRRLERFFLRAWRRWSRLTDVVSDTIPGIRV
ncbi:MAG TPA: ABC transporter transmembrane domain-containing protein, partial [Candidatus Acidoferrum sp.]|nr:ABC transporter transmembrane domain-containing protein [Candidatus Acidoferrum sp.]